MKIKDSEKKQNLVSKLIDLKTEQTQSRTSIVVFLYFSEKDENFNQDLFQNCFNDKIR
jgi:hypothetical protein